MMQNKHEANQENLVSKACQMQARDHTQYKLPMFKVDQYVLLFKSSLQNSKCKKFIQKWSGPFQIASIAPNYNYFLKDMDGTHFPKDFEALSTLSQFSILPRTDQYTLMYLGSPISSSGIPLLKLSHTYPTSAAMQ
ncbi:hypothetical protein DSO57_1030535 [Entomophthora muscae]|uniref:Uncharacterized protein n=1 Tax=Entomophthora muscae TaxID=34485 RepID=A0ACC2TNA6_9FUNG|nr:hypothetical protein DSO57_1030535 [Entomophthora muscae]